MQLPENIRLTIRDARHIHGYSQEEASELIGVSTATLSAYERGRTYPNVPILRQIEKVYGLKFEQIIFPYEEVH